MNDPRTDEPRVQVWDLPVRLMHWTLVAAVAGAWATQEIEGDWFRYHVWCGYAVLLVAATRIAWGFLGTRHARFASFLRGPSAVLAYLRGISGRGDAHYAGKKGPPLLHRHLTCGHDFRSVMTCSECGEAIDPREVKPHAGPGAKKRA